MTDLEFMKTVDIHKISQEGKIIYEEIKDRYLPQHKGEYLAIDIDSRDVFLATQGVDAVQAALKVYPGKVFYLVKIGYQFNERFANIF